MRLNNGTADGSAHLKGGRNRRQQQPQEDRIRFEISDDLINATEDSSDDDDPAWTPKSPVGRNVNDLSLRNGRSRSGTPASSVHSSVRTRQSVCSEAKSGTSATSQRNLRRRRETFTVEGEPHPYALESQRVIIKPQNGKSPSPSRGGVRVVETVAARRQTTTYEVIEGPHHHHQEHQHHLNYMQLQQLQNSTKSASNFTSSADATSYQHHNDVDYLLSSDSDSDPVIEEERRRGSRKSVSVSVSKFFSSVGYYTRKAASSICAYVYLFIVGTFLFEKWCLHVNRRKEQSAQSDSATFGSAARFDGYEGKEKNASSLRAERVGITTRSTRLQRVEEEQGSFHGAETVEEGQSFSSQLMDSTMHLWESFKKHGLILLRLALVILFLFLLWNYGSYLLSLLTSGAQTVISALFTYRSGASTNQISSSQSEPLPAVTSSLQSDIDIRSSDAQMHLDSITPLLQEIEIKLQTLSEGLEKGKGETAQEINMLREQIRGINSQVLFIENKVNHQKPIEPELDVNKLMGMVLPILTEHKENSKGEANQVFNLLETRINSMSSRIESVEAMVKEQKQVEPEVDVEKLKTVILPILLDEIQKSVKISCATRKCPEATSVLGGFSNTDIELMIKRAIARYDADKTGMPDLALESAGGSILSTRCTKSSELRNSVISYWGFRLWSPPNTPRTIIQPGVVPGECWAFEGSVGDVVIKLAVPAKVDGFTVEHIPKSISRYGHIDSAPKHFQVLGLQSEHDTIEVHDYGSFTYEDNNEPLQYFPVVNASTKFYPIVELKILSNHGNMRHTCLYRFRVHGDIDPTRSQNGAGVIKITTPASEEAESSNIHVTEASN